jgi:hypothetical protein
VREHKLVRSGARPGEAEAAFKRWAADGWELQSMCAAPGDARRLGGPGSPGTPRGGRERGDSADAPGGGVYLVFSKSLTRADVAFFDRLMSTS